MISALIFTGHLVFILYIFTKKWQEESFQSALMNAGLIILLFSVGWSIATMLLKVFIDQEGLGINLDRDAISLILLTITEYFFYKFYYSENTTEVDKGK